MRHGLLGGTNVKYLKRNEYALIKGNTLRAHFELGHLTYKHTSQLYIDVNRKPKLKIR